MAPQLSNRDEIRRRLKYIFPEGMAHRGYCTRELAASTVFAALYVGAIEGTGVFFGPKHVYRMTDAQAGKLDEKSRANFTKNIRKAGYQPKGKRWYSDNTREPIRDETLRDGLIAVGAVTEKPNVPTTSGAPRYALTKRFAELFDPSLTDAAFRANAEQWQAMYLSKKALARIALIRGGAAADGGNVVVMLPNGEVRRLATGPSALITKAVVEVFAPRFLHKPAVLFISESGKKVIARDDELARKIGINIKPDRNLPDIILVDLEISRVVFIEVVATDGPINARRKAALEILSREAGFGTEDIAFVTAYLDRAGAAFRKTVSELAWGSYAWFASEPDCLVELSEGRSKL